MYFKKMVGQKSYLSPIDINDAEKYTRWLNDFDITRYLTLAPLVISLEGEKESLVSLAKGHNYGIIALENDELIGNCGIMDIDTINRTGEIGIFIGNAEYQNKGYGSEAMTLLMDYAFNVLNLRNIMLRVYSFNARAIACYESIGFKAIGRRRNAIERNQQIFDILFMDMVPEDFNKKYGTNFSI